MLIFKRLAPKGFGLDNHVCKTEERINYYLLINNKFHFAYLSKWK